MLLLWSIVLLAIPHTRRLSKLRARHVVRAIILSIFMIAMSYELTHLIRTMYELDWIPRAAFPVLDGLPVMFCWVWLLVFWGCAVHLGWLIRPSRLLIALGTIAAWTPESADPTQELPNQHSTRPARSSTTLPRPLLGFCSSMTRTRAACAW